jgi:hypothetical protein
MAPRSSQAAAEVLLSDPLFSPDLHDAHALLRTALYTDGPGEPSARMQSGLAAGVPPLCSGGCGPRHAPAIAAPPLPEEVVLRRQLASLAAAAAEGGRLAALGVSRPALELALPHVMRCLWRSASALSGQPCAHSRAASLAGHSGGHRGEANRPGGPGSGTGSGGHEQDAAAALTACCACGVGDEPSAADHVATVLSCLLHVLPSELVVMHVLPYVRHVLAYYYAEAASSAVAQPPSRRRCASLPLRLLSPQLQLRLLASSSLDAYTSQVGPKEGKKERPKDLSKSHFTGGSQPSSCEHIS